MRPSSPFLTSLWKFASMVVIAMMTFGTPMSDVASLLPLLPQVPVAQAQEAPEDDPAIPTHCVPITFPTTVTLPGVGICTDYGQYVTGLGKVKKKISHTLVMAGIASLFSSLSYMTQTIAYDTAEWVANGFQGQAPGIFTDEWGTYVQNLSLNALGDFMGTFSEKFTTGVLGFDLCRPPNFPQLALEFSLQLPMYDLHAIQRPRPKCDWTTVTQNWSQAAQSLDNAGALQNIRANFSTGGNDISFVTGAHLGFFNALAEARYAGIQKRILGDGYKDVTNFISGDIQTPAAAVEETFNQALIRGPADDQRVRVGAIAQDAFKYGFVQLGILTASTFTNVLMTRLIDKIAKGLIKSKSTPGPNFDLLNPLAAPSDSTSPKEIFASQYSDLKTPRVTRTDAQDMLTELIGCPAEARTKWNCALDEALAAGIRQGGGLTIRQAIDQGYIDPEWELIPSNRVRDNQDPTCRSRAFCVANLRKLRLARVLPIGWELAADSPVNQRGCATSGGCVTLKEVISRFDDCGTGAAGAPQLDDSHPYCHLIDPNWVLTIFPAQCQTKGFGNQLLAGTGSRLQECQDTASCLERDKDGNCTGGYGFCMAEQTFWQFDAPTCHEQFTSCRTFKPRGSNAKPVSYLRSTLDYGVCNESNVGCMWYATRRDPQGTDVDSAWAATVTPQFTPRSHPLYDSGRVYFDKNVQSCAAGNDGCTDLRRIVAGRSALNLVQDGSFESVTGTPAVPSFWHLFGSPPGTDWFRQPLPAEGSSAFEGTKSLFPAPGAMSGRNITSNRMVLEPLRQYVFSFYARRFIQNPVGFSVYVKLTGAAQNPLIPSGGTTYFRSSGCTVLGPDQPGVVIPVSLGNTWTRFSCSFVTPPDVGRGEVTVTAGSSDEGAPFIDGIQLEEGEVATPFIDALNPALASVHMKVPPQELVCTGNAATDHALCEQFSRVCRQRDAGCQGYRPADNAGAPEVPAVLSPADQCPAECAGYAEFRKQPSTFDLVRNATDVRLDDPDDDTSAVFIPRTALSCSAQDVGCERFTNLDAATLGGEAEEAYRYLRACEKPDNDSQTYYTWEGSDTSGYQLKTWSLKRDTLASFPQGPKIIPKAGPDGFLKEPMLCSIDTYLQAQDPDCRQFYDPQGTVFYRFESQTVLSTEDCHQYRKEKSTKADCEKTGGSWNSLTGQCTYQAHPAQSLTCDAVVAGCRGYAGTQGRAQEEVFAEDFLAEGYKAYGKLGDNWAADISLSDESVLVGDKSLRIRAQGLGDNRRTVYVGPITFETGALYELSFWAKTPTPNNPVLRVTTTIGVDGERQAVGSVPLATDWRTYRIGPFTASGPDERYLTFDGPVDLWFLDRIRLERVQDVTYVVKDSWNTPASCDRTPEGVPSPQAMLGCRNYVDRKGTHATVRQFTRLCREEVIGCTAYVNTRNSPSVYTQSWGATAFTPRWGLSTGSPPIPIFVTEETNAYGDRYDYYVEDPSKFCPASADGCRAFGKPNYSQDRLSLSEQPFTTVWLLDRPESYGEALCSEQELFCESYTYAAGNGENGTAHFRAPGTHACEYRTAVVVPDGSVPGLATDGRTYDGWFRTGTDMPCHPDRLENGGIFGIRLTGDVGFNPWVGANSSQYPLYPSGEDYRGWAATCPQEQAECTEFRDVNDTSNPLRPGGRPYFVLNDTRIDRTACAGTVDPGRGCVLFRDTSKTTLLYNSAATYHLYKTRAYQPIAPVDCKGQPTHPSCEAVGATANDTNDIIKVKPDRSCSEWLSCTTAETVFDPQTGQYKSICSDLALCNKVGTPEGAGVPFCANYLDRSITTQPAHTLLREDTVVTAQGYATRNTGFGAKDYAGATTPGQFQIMDADLVPIGANFSLDPRVRARFKKDYRLAVGVPVDARTAFPGLCSVTSDCAYKTSTGAVLASYTHRKNLAGAGELVTFACVYKGADDVKTIEWDVLPDAEDVSFGLMTDADGVMDPNHNGTLDSGEAALCWLAVDQTRPPQLGVAGAPLVSDNLNMLSLITRLSQSETPQLDQTLSRSFPDTQCKAAPEADSPFGNEFVVEWDGSVIPPKASRVLAGYGQSNLCEHGEDCACAYKRVEYGGITRFYEPQSTDVVNAICINGPRRGQPCALDRGIQGSSAPVVVVQDGDSDPATNPVVDPTQFGNDPPQDNLCGAGVCVPIQSVKLVRGAEGQCLQYDLSRNIAGDPSRNECLLWNPNPVFSGPGDPYHWIPTAGFQPPQSSGRYYCASPYRQPKTFDLHPEWVSIRSEGNVTLASDFGFKRNKKNTFYTGNISWFWYSDEHASDGCTGCADGNEPGASLDGALADGTDMGEWCELIDDEQDNDGGTEMDAGSVRLVTTGKGQNRGYAEYAVLLNWQQIGAAIAGFSTTANFDSFSDADRVIIKENSMEDTISAFEFDVMPKKIGCAYSEDWVAGVGGFDYDGADTWQPADQTWHSGFRTELNVGGGRLDRRKAQIVTEDGGLDGIPVKVGCSNPDNDPTKSDPDADPGCYIKVWTIDYRATGQLKHQAFSPDIGRSSMDALSQNPVYGKCPADHSWFSIRAVFEDTDKGENGIPPDETNPNSLTGPFQIVGFWVTACSPASGPRYIYMDVSMSTADVCRELVETISKDSKDVVAFTDRNSPRSGFTIPRNGFTWFTTNIPFGASLATGDAGEEPLYMTGVKQAESNTLHAPIFTYPGQTYFRSEKYPTSNWGLLSNVFARIYRVYGYSTNAVTRDDWACTSLSSPNFGQWCPNLYGATNLPETRAELSKTYCGVEAKCVQSGFSNEDASARKVCNSFSGVNRGLDCSVDSDICHVAPMRLNVEGVLQPEQTRCEVRAVTNERWAERDQRGYWRCIGSDCPGAGFAPTGEDCSPCTQEIGCQRSVAIRCGAFRCAEGSARAPSEISADRASSAYTASFCTRLSDDLPSAECPTKIASEPCLDATTESAGTCQNHPWAQCKVNTDCHFLARNYWPSGVTNQYFNWVYNGALVGSFVSPIRNFAQEGYDTEARIPDALGNYVPNGALPDDPSDDWQDAPEEKFFQTRIWPNRLPVTQVVTQDTWDDVSLRDLYPGYVVPSWGAGVSHYAACEPLNAMRSPGGVAPRSVGSCYGGDRAGATCYEDDDCLPASVRGPDGKVDSGLLNSMNTDSAQWCNPVTGGDSTSNRYGVISGNGERGEAGNGGNSACWNLSPGASEAAVEDARNAPSREPDSALDNNICTHPAGYWPRPNWCKDPNDEYCGLFGYFLGSLNASVSDAAPLPTDVTPGLYTPLFLNPNDSTSRKLSDNPSDYDYVRYYNPIPPLVAAPDMRTCEGGSCRPTALGTLGVDGINEGFVNGGAGSHVAALRFYAWAAHEQMPLRRLVIDWGDGNQTELPDAYLKNHKPHCGTDKECSLSPGLTCQTDADCPVGGGACVAYGSCANNPNKRCSRDTECDTSETGDGICNARTYFGSDGDACEEQYFEFRHAYACLPGASTGMSRCPSSTGPNRGTCSGDINRSCSTATQCAPGDQCILNVARGGNCFDKTANACRFTPRVLLVDNWGWCTGECRTAQNATNKQLIDSAGSPVLHPNGGCFANGTQIRQNINQSRFISSVNECALQNPPIDVKLSDANKRPWIMFPGSIRLLQGDAQNTSSAPPAPPSGTPLLPSSVSPPSIPVPL